MDNAKAHRAAFAAVKDARWRAALIRANEIIDALPAPLTGAWVAAIDPVLEIAEAERISPERVAAMLALTIGNLCLVHVQGQAMDDKQVNAFIERCHAAIHIGVARSRIAAGWTPGSARGPQAKGAGRNG